VRRRLRALTALVGAIRKAGTMMDNDAYCLPTQPSIHRNTVSCEKSYSRPVVHSRKMGFETISIEINEVFAISVLLGHDASAEYRRIAE
jgi:hypothetical protein